MALKVFMLELSSRSQNSGNFRSKVKTVTKDEKLLWQSKFPERRKLWLSEQQNIPEMPNLAKISRTRKEKIRLFVENLIAVKPPKVISNSSDNQINPNRTDCYLPPCYEPSAFQIRPDQSFICGQLQATCPDNPRLQANDLNAALAFLFDVKP